MYEFRSSKLHDLVSDPLTYWYEKNNDVKTQAMIDGTTREILSYDIFTDFECNLDTKHYDEQVEGKLEGDGWVCTGHADIVGNDYVVDIKNSIQKDKDLIETYTLQVSMYCAMFGKAKGYLFVDTNKGNDKDAKKCRLVEIPIIDKETLINYLDCVKNALDIYKLSDNPVMDNNPLIDEYGQNQAEIKRLEKRQKEIEEQLADLSLDNPWIQSDNYQLRVYLRRDFERKIKIISNTWTGKYNSYIKVVEVKDKK